MVNESDVGNQDRFGWSDSDVEIERAEPETPGPESEDLKRKKKRKMPRYSENPPAT